MIALRSVVDPLGVLPQARRLGGSLGAAAGHRLGRAVLDALDAALASPHPAEAVDGALDRAIAVELHERIADCLLADGVAEQVVDGVLAGPELDRLVEQALDSPSMDRLVAEVLDSPLLDDSVGHVLASPELWLVVDRIAQSPAVTETIAHQGVGFADQVAVEVGQRSRPADARLERAARRMLHGTPPAIAVARTLPEAGPPP